jgi:CheY-like chemotaxis protein
MAEAQSSILIVDDDAEDLASVERALRPLGSELISVKDPHEVMPKVHRHRPDVVVLDALLPGLSGFDLCKQIKSDPQLKSTQVLILTGVYLRQQYRHEAIQQFKADGFLTKPFRPPELQRLVIQLLSRRTRTAPSSFLKRIGLPASSEPKKRGFLDRILGRSKAEEPASVRIAPVARDLPQPALAGAVVQAVAPRVEPAPARVGSLEPPLETAPGAAEATPASVLLEAEAANERPESEPSSSAATSEPVPPAAPAAPASQAARPEEPQPVPVSEPISTEARAEPSPAEPASAPAVDQDPVEPLVAETAPEAESVAAAPPAEGVVSPVSGETGAGVASR